MPLADEQDKITFDRLPIVVDVMKHVTTLATGSLVLIVTFFDKVEKLPKPFPGREWLVPWIGSLVVCLISACIFFALVVLVASQRKVGQWQHRLKVHRGSGLIASFSISSFGAGMMWLGVVAIANINYFFS